MRESGKEIERCPRLRGGHLGAVSLHEAAPFALVPRSLRKLDCFGTGGERRQPDIVEVLRRIIALPHAARWPPHRTDAKALVRESIGAESNNSNGHCGDQAGYLSVTRDVGGFARVLNFGHISPGIRPASVEIGATIVLRQLP